MVASILDMVQEKCDDACKAFYVVTLLFLLVKVLFLIRVFKQLSFLVMMLIQVAVDIKNFFILFMVFILIIAECYSVVQVDVSAYGRVPSLLAYALATFRSAMGDFSLIDPYNSFDLKTKSGAYRYSQGLMLFTFCIYFLCVLCLTMIFMNFIIAVISDSYATVAACAIAHDYHQRVIMIYEREMHFSESDINDTTKFPEILIVRQKTKGDGEGGEGGWEGYLKQTKQVIKD